MLKKFINQLKRDESQIRHIIAFSFYIIRVFKRFVN